MFKLFGFLSMFDWLTPAFGFFQDFQHDLTPLQSNSWTFFIPYAAALDAGWNANDIEALLHQHGIETWGGQYTFPQNEYFFRVSRQQAQWAEYQLYFNGIPVLRGTGAPGPKLISDWNYKQEIRYNQSYHNQP